MQQIGTKKV